MTRIVSGVWGGRRLTVPKGRDVRPTAERVREAWLSVLGPALPDARVLDLCAGTGALGLEALSRGAASATFVERHPGVLDILRGNVAGVGAGERARIERSDALRYAQRLPPGAFDIALADPPFASELARELVASWQAVPFATIFAVEHDPRTVLSGGATRRWGEVAVTFYRAEET